MQKHNVIGLIKTQAAKYMPDSPNEICVQNPKAAKNLALFLWVNRYQSEVDRDTHFEIDRLDYVDWVEEVWMEAAGKPQKHKTKNMKFTKAFYAETTIKALESLGWCFDDVYQDIADAKGISFEAAREDATELTLIVRGNNQGDVFYSFLDKGNNESHSQLSGDEPKSRKDIQRLYEEEMLWNVSN